MHSANMFILAWVCVVVNGANGLHSAVKGEKWLTRFCVLATAVSILSLWSWTVQP